MGTNGRCTATGPMGTEAHSHPLETLATMELESHALLGEEVLDETLNPP